MSPPGTPCSYAALLDAFKTAMSDAEAKAKCVVDQSMGEGEVVVDWDTSEIRRGPRLAMGYIDPIFGAARKSWESEDLFLETADGSRRFVIRLGDRPSFKDAKLIETMVPKTVTNTIPMACAPNNNYGILFGTEDRMECGTNDRGRRTFIRTRLEL